MKLGFSTGCFFLQQRTLVESIQEIAGVETTAVELNFGRPEELLSLTDNELIQVYEACQQFQHVSVHAPLRDAFFGKHDTELLEKLKEVALRTNARYIVFHPDMIDDAAFLEATLGKLVALENMDNRKKIGQSATDLQRFFEIMPSASFLLDLNHVFTLDKTMKLAETLFQLFSDRLVGYHISGYGNETLLHTLLYQTQELEILRGIPDQSFIAIHEGTLHEGDSLQQEYDFIQGFLANEDSSRQQQTGESIRAPKTK